MNVQIIDKIDTKSWFCRNKESREISIQHILNTKEFGQSFFQ